jgi:hypothetical protein
MSFITNRPANEPGFYLDRTEGVGRQLSTVLRATVFKLTLKVAVTNLLFVSNNIF